MRRPLIAIAACAALILTACNGDAPDPGEDPKAALRSAIQNLADYDGVDLTLSVDSDTESLTAVSEGDLSSEDAETILASSVNIRARGETAEDGQLEMVVDIDGDTVELKVVGQSAYARADVRSLVERFGGNMREVDTFVQQAGADPQFDFVGPAVEGEWIAMEGVDDLQEQFGGGATPDAQLQEQLANDLEQAIDEHSTVTSEGDDDAGHHMVANVRVRPLYETISQSFGQLPGTGIAAGQLPDASEVPDEEVRVDVWVTDDRLRRVVLDVTQFAEWDEEDLPEGVERFALQIDLDEFTDEVEAPEAAASVNLQQLLQGFFGGIMQGPQDFQMDDGPAPGDLEQLCNELEEAPPDVQEQFTEECPNLAS